MCGRESPLRRPFLPRTRRPCQTRGRHRDETGMGHQPLSTRDYNVAVRYVRQAGTDPSFLVKALGEAAGELRRSLEGLPRRALLKPGSGVDEDWMLLGVLVHLRDVER